MAITIKEIQVRTNVVRTEKKQTELTAEMVRNLKEEILRELRLEQPLTRTKRER